MEALTGTATRRRIRVRRRGRPGYPAGLSDLPRPPEVVYAQGVAKHDFARSVAIVGTRAATPYGRRCAYRLARELGSWGWTVVSGMARGIDAEAHAGALDVGAVSIGVLGSGHGHEYPRENRDLYSRMRSGGLLLSEFERDTPPRRSTFPRRNRLIAALTRATVVVEAPERSGALNTAGHALDLGREVLAVPGRIDDETARGTLALIRDGAGVVTCARDVLDALGWMNGPDAEPAPTGSGDVVDRDASPDRELVALLEREELGADEIASRTGTPVPELLSRLSRLEIAGWIEHGAGGRFRARTERA